MASVTDGPDRPSQVGRWSEEPPLLSDSVVLGPKASKRVSCSKRRARVCWELLLLTIVDRRIQSKSSLKCSKGSFFEIMAKSEPSACSIQTHLRSLSFQLKKYPPGRCHPKWHALSWHKEAESCSALRNSNAFQLQSWMAAAHNRSPVLPF